MFQPARSHFFPTSSICLAAATRSLQLDSTPRFPFFGKSGRVGARMEAEWSSCDRANNKMTNERSFPRFKDLKNLFFAVFCFRFSNYLFEQICSRFGCSRLYDFILPLCNCSSVSCVREKDVFMPANHRERNNEVSRNERTLWPEKFKL